MTTNYRQLLEQWLSVDDWHNDEIAPAELIEATRKALEDDARVVVLVEGGNVQSVWANVLPCDVVLIDRDNEAAGDVVPCLEKETAGMTAIY